ncbi:MAG: hypothetical protein LBV23_02635 [Deltaproteobacteria bacterium]|nr:hypothetical protein [Deltaproteobacteria bacterium]
MKKVLLISLILFLAFIAGIISLALAFMRGWPLWTALIAPAILIFGPLIYILFSALISYFQRRRYAKSVLNRDLNKAQPEPAFSLLKSQWQKGLKALRPLSYVGKADPIKDLPWFLLLGPNDAQKTEAMIESSLINNYRTQGGDIEPVSRKKSGVDWYLFDNCVYLDVFGLFPQNYTPEEEAESNEEFNEFLKLIGQVKRKYPLEGVTLTIPCSLFLESNEEQLKHVAMTARSRLDALARYTDTLPPLYLLITQAGALDGLAQTLKLLDESNQPSSIALSPGSIPDDALAAAVIVELEERAGDMFLDRLKLTLETITLSPIVAFPDSAAYLERPLSLLFSILGHKSNYCPSPELRLVFFSTKQSSIALLNDQSFSLVRDAYLSSLDKLSGSEEKEPNFKNIKTLSPSFALGRAQNEGLVNSLSDALARFIPQNRDLTRRLNLPGGRHQKIAIWSLSLFYFITFLFALLCLLDVHRNRAVFQTVSSAKISARQSLEAVKFSGHLGLADGLDFVLDRLDSLDRKPLLRLAKTPWPTRADEEIKSVKDDFDNHFELANFQVLSSLNDQLSQSQDLSSRLFATTLRQYIWLFSVFHAYKNGEDLATQTSFFPILPTNFSGASFHYWNLTYCDALLSYLARATPDNKAPEETLLALRSSVEKIMNETNSSDLSWLVTWADNVPDLKPISLSDILDSSLAKLKEANALSPEDIDKVSAAYTKLGRQAIIRAMNMLQNAYYSAQNKSIDEMKERFFERYDKNYLSTWQAFIRTIIKAASLSPDPSFFNNSVSQANAKSGPVFERLLSDLTTNLEPYLNSDDNPSWLKNLELDNAVFQWAEIKGKLSRQSKSIISQAESYKDTARAVKNSMPQYFLRSDLINRVNNAQPSFSQYSLFMTQINDLVNNNADSALKLAQTLFGGTNYADGSPSPFAAAEAALEQYHNQIYQDDSADSLSDLTYAIRKAALLAQKVNLIKTVAKKLDQLWANEVLASVRFLNQEDLEKAVFGQGGLLAKFQSERVAAFIEAKSSDGYAAKSWDNLTFPLSDDFLKLLIMGNSIQTKEPLADSYTVTISGVATLVDEKALEKPEKTTITLTSPDSLQQMDIYNYPVSRLFSWKPSQNFEVMVTISFPSLELYVNYAGSLSFPNFLSDINKGELRLKPEDFPDHCEQLKALGVSEIVLIIKADNANSVVRYLKLSPIKLPPSIIKPLAEYVK